MQEKMRETDKDLTFMYQESKGVFDGTEEIVNFKKVDGGKMVVACELRK